MFVDVKALLKIFISGRKEIIFNRLNIVVNINDVFQEKKKNDIFLILLGNIAAGIFMTGNDSGTLSC